MSAAILAIATRQSPGFSRGGKVPGITTKKTSVTISKLVAHVGLFGSSL